MKRRKKKETNEKRKRKRTKEGKNKDGEVTEEAQEESLEKWKKRSTPELGPSQRQLQKETEKKAGDLGEQVGWVVEPAPVQQAAAVSRGGQQGK